MRAIRTVNMSEFATQVAREGIEYCQRRLREGVASFNKKELRAMLAAIRQRLRTDDAMTTGEEYFEIALESLIMDELKRPRSKS